MNNIQSNNTNVTNTNVSSPEKKYSPQEIQQEIDIKDKEINELEKKLDKTIKLLKKLEHSYDHFSGELAYKRGERKRLEQLALGNEVDFNKPIIAAYVPYRRIINWNF